MCVSAGDGGLLLFCWLLLLLLLLLCVLESEMVGGWTCLFDKPFASWEHGSLLFAATVLFSVNRLESCEKEKEKEREERGEEGDDIVNWCER